MVSILKNIKPGVDSIDGEYRGYSGTDPGADGAEEYEKAATELREDVREAREDPGKGRGGLLEGAG